MRVRKFCMQEEVEIWRKCKLFISHFNQLALTLLDNCSAVNWLNDGINVVLKILNKYWISLLDSEFNCLDHLWISQSCNFKTFWIPCLSQPGNTLKLWINDETVSFRVVQDTSILYWYCLIIDP
jgi:hypothetical protein